MSIKNTIVLTFLLHEITIISKPEKWRRNTIEDSVQQINDENTKHINQLRKDLEQYEKQRAAEHNLSTDAHNNLAIDLEPIKQNFLERDKVVKEKKKQKEQALTAMQSFISRHLLQQEELRQNAQQEKLIQDKKKHKVLKKEMIALSHALVEKIWPIIDNNKQQEIIAQQQALQEQKQIDKLAYEQAKKQREKEKRAAKKATKQLDQNSQAISPTSVTMNNIQDFQAIETKFKSDGVTFLRPKNKASLQFENFCKWRTERENAEKKYKKPTRNIDSKLVSKSKSGGERELKRQEQEREILQIEKDAHTILIQYSQLLHANTSLDTFLDLEQKFKHIQYHLEQHGRSLNWYLAHNPQLYDSIKHKYLSLQGRIDTEEKNHIISQLRQNKKTTIENNTTQNKLLLCVILNKLQEMHTSIDGILNVSHLIHAPIAPQALENLGTLSCARLEQAKEDIQNHVLGNNNFSYQPLKPIISNLLTEIGIQANDALVTGIINQSGEIAVVQTPHNCNPDLLIKIGAICFDSLRQKNELHTQPYTINQMADIAKINIAIIKPIIQSLQQKKDTIK